MILEANEGIGVLEKSEVMNLHLRSIAKDRLIDKIGVLNLIHLEKIRKGLNEIMMMD